MFPVPVLSADEVAHFRGELEATERELGGTLKRLDNAHLHFRWAVDLVTHPLVLDAMEDLLGPDLLIHSSRIFYKHAHDPAYVGWHQDGLYARLDTDYAPSLWIALSDSLPDNGCLRVVPGSHRHGKYEHRETYARDNLSNHGEQIELAVDPAAAIDVALQPGQMSVHHVNSIHGSEANRSDRPRIGFSASFITPDIPAGGMQLVVARGCQGYAGGNTLDALPPSDIRAGIASHADYVRRHGRGLRLE
jgi:non-heme Fe2+,alpha-ketoglutarate-dependent halogenase